MKKDMCRIDVRLAKAVSAGIFTSDEVLCISALVHFHDGSASDMPDSIQQTFIDLMEIVEVTVEAEHG